MYPIQQIIWLLLPLVVNGDTISYTIPSTVPSGAAVLDPAPVGVSFEFFAFPDYFNPNVVRATNQCLKNFEDLTGTWPPIRLGGTTQDRATYNASSPAAVTYTVASPVDAPATLTFGPSYMSLAATYQGRVVLGLNRGYNAIANTIAAAQVAVDQIKNLIAIELGNEPEYWSGVQPIANGGWSPAIDAESQDNWDIRIGQAVNRTSIIQACNSLSGPPTWGSAELIATENDTALSYVHDYAHHNYPGGSLTGLMTHSNIVNNLKPFVAEVAAAAGVGKEYVFGETNSVSGGGAATVSPLFGAALWTMDFSLRASLVGVKRSYFHHGTIGACNYCWWGRYDTGSPYYGAYAAVATMAGGSYISALDPGTTGYAAYVIYDSANNPLKVLLYNSDYYSGTGTRGTQTFALAGLGSGTLKAKRLTAPNSNSRVDQGSNPSFGGQNFANGTCLVTGTETFESTQISGGSASFTVAASEALLVYLQ